MGTEIPEVNVIELSALCFNDPCTGAQFQAGIAAASGTAGWDSAGKNFEARAGWDGTVQKTKVGDNLGYSFLGSRLGGAAQAGDDGFSVRTNAELTLGRGYLG